jgi:hypothetical protein
MNFGNVGEYVFISILVDVVARGTFAAKVEVSLKISKTLGMIIPAAPA